MTDTSFAALSQAAIQSGRKEPRWFRAVDRISTVFGHIGAIAGMLLLLHVTADVIGRSVFGRPLGGTLEIVQYWYMPAIVFFGLAFTQLRDEHLKVILLTESLPPRIRKVAEMVGQIIPFLLVLVLLYFGWSGANYSMSIGETALGTVNVPTWPPRFFVVIGLGMLLVQFFVTIYRMILKPASAYVTDEDDELGALG